MGRRSSSKKRGLGQQQKPARLGVEPLEDRRMLAVLAWENRGDNGGPDTDGFQAAFGASSAVARAIVDRAIDDWETAIIDFNYAAVGGAGQPSTDNTFALTIDASDLGAGSRGVAQNAQFDADGKPFSADITMDDDGGGGGWFFDSTPGDDSEFTLLEAQSQASFLGAGAAANDDDFYRTILHEIGHAIGITNAGNAAIQLFLSDSGLQDANDAASDLFRFDGAGGTVTFTTNGGLHIYEGPAVGSLPTHPEDLMNPGRTVGAPPTTRQLITPLNLQVLSDAYGYRVIEADQLAAFVPIDALEPNNSLEDATVLGAGTSVALSGLSIHATDDDDFFQVTASQTGKLSVRLWFDDTPGDGEEDLDLQVLDATGNVIASSVTTTDDETLAIPVVSQETYFVRVFGVDDDVNTYDLEIENFAAPIPDAVILNPADDSGLSNLDAVTFDATPEVFIQADLLHFADLDNDGTISGTDEERLRNAATVEVFVNGVVSPGTTTTVAGTNDTLFRHTLPAGSLNGVIPFSGGFLNFVTAAVRITDGQDPAASARTRLSEPLRLIRGDVEGPTITSVQVNNNTTYNLFDPKPADGPTPAVNSLTIRVEDGPDRDTNFLHDALNAAVAGNPGLYRLVGDTNGEVTIASVTVVNDAPAAGSPATATIRLFFNSPLPDDRFTLTISDALVDTAGNRLDGESDAGTPGAVNFVVNGSGDGQAGGDFVAKFNVDSAAELGTWSTGSVYLDTNGNFTFDPQNADATNRDIVHTLGFAADAIFAGNFAFDPDPMVTPTANGFDKLAAYGIVAGTYRWLIDLTDDGVPDQVFQEAAGFLGSGTPVAGNFDGNAANGDEIGWFNGNGWRFDTDRSFTVGDNAAVTTTIFGLPIVGDFDGNGTEDLGTYNLSTNTFNVLMNPSFAAGTELGGTLRTFQFSDGYPFSGVRDRPVAADFNADGFDDIGLWVPDRTGVPVTEAAEWYLLLSGATPVVAPTAGTDRIVPDLTTGDPVIQFTPVPFGGDRFAQFGDDFAVPIVGNFDPPVTGATTTTVDQVPGDFNGDGSVGDEDHAEWAGAYGSVVFPNTSGDANGDGLINAADYAVWRDQKEAAVPAQAIDPAVSAEEPSRVTEPRDAGFAVDTPPTGWLRPSRVALRAVTERGELGPQAADHALLLLASYGANGSSDDAAEGFAYDREADAETGSSAEGSADEAFAGIGRASLGE